MKNANSLSLITKFTIKMQSLPLIKKNVNSLSIIKKFTVKKNRFKPTKQLKNTNKMIT